MTVEVLPPTWHRELPDHITVALDGTLLDNDPDLGNLPDRVTGRIVITMPDYAADSLAHLIAAVCRAVDLFGGTKEWVGLADPDLAEALAAACAASGYHCPGQPASRSENSAAALHLVDGG
jgi:hypothetical protein